MLILASSSPRRKEILSSIISNYKVIKPSFNEDNIKIKSVKSLIYFLAYNKGLDISKKYPSDYILSADTLVVYKNKIFGKPLTKKKAIDYLTILQGKTHIVYSQYFIIRNEKIIKKNLSISKVFIEPLTEDEINLYVNSLLPLDKAGGYGIQDKDYITAKVIKGNFFSIMGLNKNKLIKDLKSLKLI